jgi:hypothetical protein
MLSLRSARLFFQMQPDCGTIASWSGYRFQSGLIQCVHACRHVTAMPIESKLPQRVLSVYGGRGVRRSNVAASRWPSALLLSSTRRAGHERTNVSYFPRKKLCAHFKSSSSGLGRRVVLWYDTNVSEVHGASIFGVKPHYTASQSGRPRPGISPPWKPQNSYYV